jgi:hypothetical protein
MALSRPLLAGCIVLAACGGSEPNSAEPLVRPASTASPARAAEISAVVDSARARFADCFAPEVDAHPEARGAVNFVATVGRDGVPVDVQTRAAESRLTLAPTTLACVRMTLTRLRFPSGATMTTVIVPLQFGG